MELVEGLSILGRYNFKPIAGVNLETYSGALDFNSDIKPFISEINHRDYELVIVLDREGIGVEYYNNPPEDDVTSYHLRKMDLQDTLMFLKIIMLYNKTKEEIIFILKNFFEIV